MFRRTWKSQLSPAGKQRGSVLFLLYLLVFPRLNGWIQSLFMRGSAGEELVAEANVIYYIFLFMLCLFAFWSFLKKDMEGLVDWLPENFYGVVATLAGSLVPTLILRKLPFPVRDPIPLQYAQEYALAPGATLVLILVLIPLVEETMFRGFLYGQLREYSRPGAAVIVTVAYAIFQVWRYAWDLGDPRYLILTLLYLPMSAGLTLCYENGGSVWACAVMHSAFNGLTLLVGP